MPNMPCGERQMSPWNAKKPRATGHPVPLARAGAEAPSTSAGGERVSKTSENRVKIQCDGVAVRDTAAWHGLIEEYVPVELTWLSRPLLQQRGDVSLTSAEGEQVVRELREAREMERLRMKAKTLLELYRNHGRHPRKLIMNLAYDSHSVNPLWEEAVDRWGEPAVELQGPTRVQEVLAYWDEAGGMPAATPPMPCSPRSDGGTSSLEASDVGDEVTDAAAGAGGQSACHPRVATSAWKGITFKFPTMGEYGGKPARVYWGRWKQE